MRERRYGRSAAASAAQGVSGDHISATVEDGLLEIVVEGGAEPREHEQIEIAGKDAGEVRLDVGAPHSARRGAGRRPPHGGQAAASSPRRQRSSPVHSVATAVATTRSRGTSGWSPHQTARPARPAITGSAAISAVAGPPPRDRRRERGGDLRADLPADRIRSGVLGAAGEEQARHVRVLLHVGRPRLQRVGDPALLRLVAGEAPPPQLQQIVAGALQQMRVQLALGHQRGRTAQRA